MADTVGLTFDGRTLRGRAGLSLAACLTEAGIRALREGPGGGSRGIFCGMGVCQDCLVEVDGHPNRRACMTKVEDGMAVRTQTARPKLAAGPQTHSEPLVETPDVLIVGGGAGGLSAAIAAAEVGASVLVLDERRVAGGQYFKQRGDRGTPLDAQQAAGLALHEKALRSSARIIDSAEVWGAFKGPVIYATEADAAVIVRPKTLIVATGAYERPRFVRGWDLPGVMTTGAAQTLWRSYATLPGRRVAIVGNGPLNLQVADELRAGGAEIMLVAEAASAPWTKFGTVAAMLATSPGLTLTGLQTAVRLMRSGTPMRFQALVSTIEQAADGLDVEIRDGAGRLSRWSTDVVCMNYGFHPQNEIMRLLGATFEYDSGRAQLICRRNEDCETTVPGLFAVGDCCGMGGAPAALEEGRIAGRAAAARALGIDAAADHVSVRRLTRHRMFQKALWTLFSAKTQEFEDIDPRAPICRCEGLSRADIEEPVLEPGNGIGGVKRATRAGMGRCQGRYCSHVMAPRMAAALGEPMGERSYFAPRVPIKPVEIAAILAAEEAGRDKP
jgi:pyruvate/2-oxoglutarate dehydrogenase complex dihydrolipoamide dehydrogenase (E3) component